MLLVSHDASLSGAPRIAVEILLASRDAVEKRSLVIRWPGPLAGDLAAAADSYRLEPYRRTRVSLRRFRMTRDAAIRVEEAAAKAVLRRENPDLVYLNSVLSACYIRPALARGMRVVLHSHELNDAVSWGLSRYDLGDAYRKIRLVACSEAAKRCLQETTGTEDVTVLPSVVDAGRVHRLVSAGESQATFRGPDGLVIACGATNETKGTDLWLRVARAVKERLGPVCPEFVWIGGSEIRFYERLARGLGVADRVHFLGQISNPYPIMASADILTVPSRQDAFPLVVLEGMCLGVPIVAFDVGGIADQVGDAGVLVKSGDVEGMADAVQRLIGDARQRRRLADLAQRRADTMHNVERFRAATAALVAAELERAG